MRDAAYKRLEAGLLKNALLPASQRLGRMAICKVTSERMGNGVPVSDIRYHIGSDNRRAEEYMKWVRDNWGIENRLNWPLGVCFREGEQHHWAGQNAENLSWPRKLALCLLKAAKSS